jgi:hypothetical protein
MFEVVIGKEGLSNSHQGDFPETTTCVHCQALSEIGFTVLEKPSGGEERFVSDLYKNDPKGTGYWLHDCCAVAVYFCPICFRSTSLFNQG